MQHLFEALAFVQAFGEPEARLGDCCEGLSPSHEVLGGRRRRGVAALSVGALLRVLDLSGHGG
jgi:hypothetical protein